MGAADSRLRLLIVDDEQSVLHALRRDLRMRMQDQLPRLEIDLENDAKVALEKVQEVRYAVVISDYRMPDGNGVQLLAAARQAQPDTGRIILSGQIDLGALQDAVNNAGVHYYLPKPWRNDDVADAVGTLVQSHVDAVERAQQADTASLQQGKITPQEAERRRLERLEPGITHVEWTPDGAVVLRP